MVNGTICDEADCFLIDPLPECDIFSHDVGFEFRFQFKIEDLQLSLRFEGNDFRGRMHDCAIRCDGSTHH